MIRREWARRPSAVQMLRRGLTESHGPVLEVRHGISGLRVVALAVPRAGLELNPSDEQKPNQHVRLPSDLFDFCSHEFSVSFPPHPSLRCRFCH
jgi:hypothetical protein